MLMSEARALQDRLTSIRREIHRQPELGLETENTARLIERELRAMGIASRRVAGTGVVALLAGDLEGSAVLLRADTDALPLQEESGVAFPSDVPGRMHACGHDAHTTVLLGAAALLKQHERELTRPVKLVFQPGEEGPGGAVPMIEAGVLEHPGVDAAMMVHVTPDLPVGTVGFCSGYAMANTDDVTVTVKGKGGHAAHPEQGADAIVIAAQIVLAAQTLVSRMTDPIEPVVLTFGTVRGGARKNILPAEVELAGTIRTMSPAHRTRMAEGLKALAENIAAASNATAVVRIDQGYPSLYCDDTVTEHARSIAAEVLTQARVLRFPPSMGGEDFAYFAEKVPSTLLRLGVRGSEFGHAPLHSSTFSLDEAALPVGAAVMAAFAMQRAGTV